MSHSISLRVQQSLVHFWPLFIAFLFTPGAQVKTGSNYGRVIRPARRSHSHVWLLKMGMVAALVSPVLSPAAFGLEDPHWTGTWAAAPSFAEGNTQYTNQTLRLVVHTSLGGNQVRVKFSNTFGAKPLKIGAAHIAFRDVGAKIVVNSDRVLTFSGRPFVEIPVGALVISDPVYIRVAPLIDIAVSVYLSGVSTAETSHIVAQQTSFVAHSHGDFTGAADLPGAGQTSEWDFLTGIDILDNEPTAAIVAVGDSQTDGIGSTPDANRRWTNVLANRLQSNSSHNDISVLNEALSGNRLLHPAPEGISFFGPAALARFDRDVLGQAGVKYLIVLLGLGDISQPGVFAPPAEEVSADDVIAGLLQLIERAHEKGLVAYGCTMTPFKNSDFYTPEKELKREEVNHWIRTSDVYDAVIDFDKVVRDPTHPKRLLPAFDSGDHTHPNDAGYKAMGQAIDLDLFVAEDH
jgi:lysophospholipase L1-like esterase